MSDSMSVAIDRLGWLTFSGRHLTTTPAKVVPAIDRLLRGLADAWDGPMAFLGPVLDRTVPDNLESGQGFRAAVLIPDGVGVLVWTSKEREDEERLKAGEVDRLTAGFVSFRLCGPAVQKELLPHIEPLLGRLYRQLSEGKERKRRNPSPSTN